MKDNVDFKRNTTRSYQRIFDAFKRRFLLTTHAEGPSTSKPMYRLANDRGNFQQTRPYVPQTHYSQLSVEKEARIHALFDQLDVNGDGVIDLGDLTKALKVYSPDIPTEDYANRMMSKADRMENEMIDLSEFIQYVLEHEKSVKVVFENLDINKDGVIDLGELIAYMHSIGIDMGETEAKSLIERITCNGSKTISLDEFQNYLLFCPDSDFKTFVNYWRHNLSIDIGEDAIVPEEFSETERQLGIVWRHLVSGGIAGAVSRTCTAPLDRLKVYLQVHGGKARQALWAMKLEGGLTSFWRGNGVNVIKIAPETAIKFMSYEQAKRLIVLNRDRDITTMERFCAGSIAGCISQTSIYPMEVLKTRLALRRTGQMNRGLLDAAKTLYRKEGLRTFYRGYVPNLLGIVPYAGIDLCTYETLKNFYSTTYGNEPGVLTVLACGTTSSTCGMMVAYPLALVRTRLQALAWLPNADKIKQPETMVGQFKSIISTDGFFGLWRGITPNLGKVIPAVSISYVMYETVRQHLGASMT